MIFMHKENLAKPFCVHGLSSQFDFDQDINTILVLSLIFAKIHSLGKVNLSWHVNLDARVMQRSTQI